MINLIVVTHEKPGDSKDVRFHTDNWAIYPWRFWAEQFLYIERWCIHA